MQYVNLQVKKMNEIFKESFLYFHKNYEDDNS